ncbi:hypothetical protein [Pseudomonas phage D6]|nr:hypothetical protein [Pseudomonas phage D6]
MSDHIHCNRYEQPGNCYTGRIGPGILKSPADREAEAAFMQALQTLPLTEHPAIKAFQDGYKEQMMSGTEIPCAHEPHGTGSHDLPDVVTPEVFMDRYTHQAAFEAIMKFEAELIKVKPIASATGSFLEVSAPFVLSGRVTDIVRQKYLDAGWKTVTLTQVNPNSTSLKVIFP